MRYDAVIFDLFGTLVDNLYEQPYTQSLLRTGEAAGCDPHEFLRLWRDESLAALRATGAFGSQAVCIETICRRLGVEPDAAAVERAARIRLDFVREAMAPRPDAADTLGQIKRRGLKLALMSVCSPDAAALWPQSPLASCFDRVLLSCLVGLTKPDPRFYALASERLGAGPQRCLYVGDGAGDELTGARAASMTGVLICAPHEADVVLARDEARNWSGPRIASIGEVVGLLDDDAEAGPAEARP